MFTRSLTAFLLCICLAAPATAATFNVSVTSNRFVPSSLTIHVGDSVRFTNAGGFHNVAADDGSFRCAQGCDGSGGNGTPSGSAWTTTVTFDTAGDIGYHCEVHAGMGMVGTISVEGTTPPAPFNLNQHGLSGSWANAATDSQGVVMTVWPDHVGPGRGSLFGGWFTYDVTAAGGQRWYTVQGDVTDSDDSATMPIYQTQGGAFDTSQATSTAPVGQAVMHFDDCTHGSLAYTFSDGSGRSGTIPLARLLANVNCTTDGTNTGGGAYLRSGAWADLGTSGQGLVMDINPPQSVFFAAWYTFLANADPNAGASGQHWYTLQAAIPASFSALTNVGIYESTGGVFDQHATTATAPVGSADITWQSCSLATMAYTFTAGPHAGLSGTLDLTRLGPVPAGCSL
jgi:plastocyanin